MNVRFFFLLLLFTGSCSRTIGQVNPSIGTTPSILRHANPDYVTPSPVQPGRVDRQNETSNQEVQSLLAAQDNVRRMRWRRDKNGNVYIKPFTQHLPEDPTPPHFDRVQVLSDGRWVIFQSEAFQTGTKGSSPAPKYEPFLIIRP
ncbi:hypothetical protein [Spirosoma sp. KUDC1026]|uniref:hypothetical protein n=1 Tax=Spirosoma sp. KUDC1026 TaxID=2745947 RepID=UPI00159BAC49|nr:hypothetical protein [Spirosoma sp. KUDC1026]QKZ13501.1 hypothetical protein HU175_12995 [Spirosoma sp. KUDC1026]